MGQRRAKMDSGLVDCAVGTQKGARKNSQKAYKSSLSRLRNADSDSTSASESLNKLEFAELPGSVLGRRYQDKDLLSECSGRSIRNGQYDLVDRMNMQQVQMRAKALADQMFIKSLICKQGKNFESKSFSNALELLNLDKDLFMDMLPYSNSLQSRRAKNTHRSQTEEELLKAVLDSKVTLACENLDVSISQRHGSALATEKRKMNKQVSQAIDYPSLCSSNTSVVAQPPDKIVISKPGQKNIKYVETINCHCSPIPSHKTPSRTVSDKKQASFSFRGMKKRLKHTFGGARGEPSSVPQDGALDDCIANEALRRKRDLDANRGKKLDSSGVGYSKKPEFDVILEAKRHLSARLKNVRDAEPVNNEKSFRTLMRILDSPEHDLWSPSPGRDSQNCSCSAQMRFSPYSNSPTVAECSSQISNRRRKCCLNPPRPNSTAVTWCDDYRTYDDTKTASRNQSTSGDARKASVSATDNKNFNGDSTNPTPELHIEFKLDDLPSTPSSVCQLADSNKFHEEHRSPVSVLEPIFTEDANSPQSTTLQPAQQPLQPLHLDFEEHSMKLIPHNAPINTSSSIGEQHQLSEYMHSVLQASCLSWERLSDAMFVLPNELLHEVEFPLCDCHFDPKLLFDHITEVLLEIQKSYFTPPPWVVSKKPKIMCVPLQEVVLDKIMAEADFYLVPRTERTTTLDQIVWKDVANSRSWLDVGPDAEQIAVDISEDLLENCIGDMLHELLV